MPEWGGHHFQCKRNGADLPVGKIPTKLHYQLIRSENTRTAPSTHRTHNLDTHASSRGLEQRGEAIAREDTEKIAASIAMAGAVKHIVLLKFKDSVTPDQQSALIEKYAALPNSISAMKGFEWGTDMSVENMHQGFTHVFISTFDSPKGRDEYLVHPVHEAFAKELLAALDNGLVVDYNPTVTLKAA